jgi:L(+)-tartrate dehydratase beta subunit
MAHFDIVMPVAEAQVRGFRIGDTVTLNGTLFGIRDRTQIEMFDRGRTTRARSSGRTSFPRAMRRFASAPRPPRGWSGSRGR